MTTKTQDWVRHGRAQRSITVRGQHFFAQQSCRPTSVGQRLWMVEEMNQAEVNGSRAITPWSKPMPSHRLSAYVDAVVDYREWLDAGREPGDPWSGRFETSGEADAARLAFFAARGFEI